MRVFLLMALAATAGCKRSAPRVSDGGAIAAAGGVGPIIVACKESGCSLGDEGAPREGGELVIAVEAEPAVLCDLVEHDAWSRWILENEVTETLLEQDPWTGALTPRLAAAVTRTKDALTLTLRANVRWHDGRPFSSADVAFTIGRARDPAVGADQRSDFDPVSAVETPDASTVVLRLAAPAPFLEPALAHLAILPEHLYQGRDLRRAEASRAPVGTGAWKFVSWQRGEELVLARNPDYWGKKAHLDRLRFRFIRDRQAAYELYLRGELDLLWSVPSERLDDARREPRLLGHHMFVWTLRAGYFVVINTARGRLGDGRVRRALAMLIDRERYNRVAFGGHARALTGPYAPGTPSYDAAVAPWPFDPEAAKKLLAEAHVSSLKLTFLSTAGSRTADKLATLMKEDFAKAGVTLEVATVDFAVQLERLREHAFDLSSLRFVFALEQDNFTLFHSSAAARGQNYAAWKSPEADRLLTAIRGAADADARHRLEKELHRLVHDEAPYVFLSMNEVETLTAPRVHGLFPSQDGFSFARAWLAPAP